MITAIKIRWYVEGFLKKYGVVLGVSTVLGIILFVILPNLLSSIPLFKPTSYIGRVGAFPLSRLPRDIQDKVSMGLTRATDDGQFVPALASSFHIEEDGKAYRFTIRPNVFWQDGTETTPADVSYVFADIDIARSQNDIVYRIRPPKDDQTPAQPFLPSSFLSLVSQPLFKQQQTKRFFFFEKNTIYGLGDYHITSFKYAGPSLREITLESERERLVYRFYQTEHDAIVAFKHGNVERLELIQNIEDLKDWQTVGKRIETHDDQYVALFFNLNYSEGDTGQPYNNRNLRQALNLSLQKPQGNDRILSPIHKRSWAYVGDETDVDRFEQDLTAAIETLSKAELQKPVAVELTTIPTYIAKAETIKKSWEELGALTQSNCQKTNGKNCDNFKISVQIRLSNVPDLSNYQVLLVGQQIPVDPDQYTFWHSTQQTNFTHYKNARVDKLLEDARKSTNREERKLYYQEFQRILIKDSPAIFLEPIKTYTVWHKSDLL
ncbi:hypothetical protein KBD71_02770 [Candidatus Woesebacteria bacterium]|nr:hypothetical protein [Candidatus Woesebacteria bacterium]